MTCRSCVHHCPGLWCLAGISRYCNARGYYPPEAVCLKHEAGRAPKIEYRCGACGELYFDQDDIANVIHTAQRRIHNQRDLWGRFNIHCLECGGDADIIVERDGVGFYTDGREVR